MLVQFMTNQSVNYSKWRCQGTTGELALPFIEVDNKFSKRCITGIDLLLASLNFPLATPLTTTL